MLSLDQLKNTFDSRNTSPLVGEHYVFYLRGLINAALPEFMSPLSRTVTENGVSGEYLEALRLVATTMFPDMKDGDVQTINYKDVMNVLGGVSIFQKEENRFAIETVGERLRTTLGEFGITKENGQYIVFDTYDYENYGDGTLTGTVQQAYQEAIKAPTFSQGLYESARTMGGYFMPENPDRSSREDALKVRIAIPKEPLVIDVDYDDPIPEEAEEMVLRGPMTNKRKSLFDSFMNMIISPAEAMLLETNTSEEAIQSIAIGLLQEPSEDGDSFNRGITEAGIAKERSIRESRVLP